MSDYGRIYRELWRPDKKARRAGNAAMGLWTLGISWCKDHRSAGRIAGDAALELGTQDEIDALVRERLWRKTSDGYLYNDWSDWNQDVEPDTVGGDLVRKIVPESQPKAVRVQLSRIAGQLIMDGSDPAHVETGLRFWLDNTYPPTSLPQFVSQAARMAESNKSKLNALREAWVDGKTSRLTEFGLIFTPGPAPEGMSDMALRAHRLTEKRAWIEGLVKEIEVHR